MRWAWLQRIRAALHTEEIHQEIAEELEFHIQMRAAELMRGGMPEAAACVTARRRFGAPVRIQEQGFDVRGGGVVRDIAADVRLAVRVMRKAPGKTAALVATVALGIGINTAVFSVVKSVVLDPLPFPESGRLVAIHQAKRTEAGGVSYPNFVDWRAASRSFEGMAVFSSTSATMTAGDRALRVFGATVSADLFRILRVTPVRGRLFLPGEDALGGGETGSRPVLISDALWGSHFERREDVLGRALVLDGIPYRVVGVIPSRLAFPVQTDPVDYWTTVAVDAEPSLYGGTIPTSRGYPRYDAAIARLRPPVTPGQAQAEMSVIAGNVARLHPKTTSMEEARVSPAMEDVVGKVRPLLWMLYGAVFCVLAVACANVATLLLVSAVARSREFALRAALGARPARLVRQLLIESLAVALCGGAVGVLLARWLVEVFVRLAPAETPRLAGVHVDGVVLLYALGVTVLTGLLFGVAPALAALRHDLVGTLKEGARTFGRGRGRFRPGTVLIAGQIAVSMMLGCSAAVLTGSFLRILHTPRGFDAHRVLTASIGLPPVSYERRSEKLARFYAGLLQELRRLPAVESASIAQSLPLSGQNNSTTVDVVGMEERGRASADLRFVDAEYFRTLRIPLISGRFPDQRDARDSPPIVVVNQAFVARFLDGRSAPGTQLRLGWGGSAPKQIVGVAGDIRHNALSPQAAPEVYVPAAQFPINDMAVLLRTSGDPHGVAGALRDLVRRMDPSVPVEDVRTLDEYLLRSAAPRRFLMWVLVTLAASALLLAASGLYGVLSYSTACRGHEFGVRMALGADVWSVMRLVLAEGLGIAVAGMAGGLALTSAASQLLAGWLYDTSPMDGASVACAGAALIAVAAAACWLPARRATKVDPLVSLRGE